MFVYVLRLRSRASCRPGSSSDPTMPPSESSRHPSSSCRPCAPSTPATQPRERRRRVGRVSVAPRLAILEKRQPGHHPAKPAPPCEDKGGKGHRAARDRSARDRVARDRSARDRVARDRSARDRVARDRVEIRAGAPIGLHGGNLGPCCAGEAASGRCRCSDRQGPARAADLVKRA